MSSSSALLLRDAFTRFPCYPQDLAPTAVEALRKLAGHWPDKELAVSLNRMRCKTGDGETWTTVRVREMRERLGLPEYDSEKSRAKVTWRSTLPITPICGTKASWDRSTGSPARKVEPAEVFERALGRPSSTVLKSIT